MSKNRNTARVTAGLVGVAAVIAASVLPGTVAVAESTGDVTVDVTRAVLIQGNADGEISRKTLVTQINAEGTGTASFTVPVGDGGTPKNMDSFGSPEIVDGSAQYDLDVDGTQAIRTSQNYDGEIPVTVTAEATLDGTPIKVSELAGKSGLVKLTYTFENTTGEPTQLTYKDALGNTITEEAEIPAPMAGSLNITFPDSWGNVTAPTATTVSGDGSGATLVSATVPLLPETLPGQQTSGSVEIEARLNDAVVPPADIKFAVIPPDTTPDLQAGRKTAEDGADLAGKLTDAGKQLADGAGQLADGLATAVEGATALADGVGNTLGPGVKTLADGVAEQLGPGVQQLSEGLTTFDQVAIGTLRSSAQDLPASVTSDPSFSQLTDGFDAVNSAIEGVRDGLGVFKLQPSQKPGPWIKKNGDVDTGRADVARTLWSLIYGARTQDIPTDSKNPNNVPNTNNGGLTNPDCDINKPKDPTNPCGAFQIIAAVVDGLENTAVPGLGALSGGLKTISDTLADTKSGGAFAIQSLAETLGCTTSKPAGYTGPVVGPAVGLAGNPCSKSISVGGSDQCTNPFQAQLPLPQLPCNLIVNALLGGVDLKAPSPTKLPGLSQSLFAPLKLTNSNPPQPTTDSGLVAVLGTYYPTAFTTAVIPGLKQAADGLTELNGVITTKSNGDPDLDTTKKTTATGIVMQVRNNLALGGIGSDLYPGGRCTGYARTGDPNSGINENADPDSVAATCAAADVLNLALFGTDALEDGVSTTLLEGIRDTLLEGVGNYSPGCDPTKSLACASGTLAAGGVQLNEGVNGSGGLVEGTQQLNEGVNEGSGGSPSLVSGTRQLADGLPAAVDGANQIKTDGGEALQEQGNDGSKQAGVAVATLDALQARASAGAGIPGGAPVGATSFGGVYAFELSGAGGTGTQDFARAALALLALIGAGAVGAVVGKSAGA
jgi:putative membrane protein